MLQLQSNAVDHATSTCLVRVELPDLIRILALSMTCSSSRSSIVIIGIGRCSFFLGRWWRLARYVLLPFLKLGVLAKHSCRHAPQHGSSSKTCSAACRLPVHVCTQAWATAGVASNVCLQRLPDCIGYTGLSASTSRSSRVCKRQSPSIFGMLGAGITCSSFC